MISKRASQINPSLTLAISAKAKEMKTSGIDVISFGAGEPDFDTPENIKEAAIQAIRSGFTKYTTTSGIPELKDAICKKFERDNHLSYERENILVSTGAKQCLFNLMQVLINPGDRVILPVPYWVSYEEMVKLAGGKCDLVRTKGFRLDPNDFRSVITDKTKLLILNSPSNPTGYVYSRHELQEIADICVEKNILVVSDEIYEPLIYEKEHISIAELGEKIKNLTIIVNGVSKAYSMTGWRIGYCAGDKTIIRAAALLQDHMTSNPNSIAQKAGVEALNGPQEIVATMRGAYKKRRDYIIKRLSKINGVSVSVPDGAFYVFVNVSALFNTKIHNSSEFCTQLLEQKHVAAVPGSAFGDDAFIRLSYATSDKNIENGLDRLEGFVRDIV